MDWKPESWGWDEALEADFAAYRQLGYEPGRVTLEHKRLYRVVCAGGELLAEVSGKLMHQAGGRADYPAVGDWVALQPRLSDGRATIHGLVPRRSTFSRRAAGPAVEEQIVAANVDIVFLVHALNQDYNLRRLERYLTLAYESGASPVIILSKADLADDVETRLAEVGTVAPGVPVHAVSTLTGEGLEPLESYLQPGRTAALLGSSGAGKSTLVNRLYGSEVLRTGGIREGDDRGRHTTTHRELIRLPGGALLIDTPGMRELQLWDADSGLGTAFGDVEELALACRFGDCGHGSEPGCAVRAALEDGTLSSARYQNYVKLQKELAYEARKADSSLARAEKERLKSIHSSMRNQSKGLR
ncbi:ribosome biogenesis GTPase [Paenibacillus sp. UNCCL117]|uniref:ribosome small subunit-dependent GTPase A n=1 Tax=unclassified Paenibacillus TaxID=185978 RepID=UPI00088E2534|nr:MULTISPECIES: ribosome small subunit-dependent GTPase A [unclassified Paenibacillus]SDD14779.1 ribosome biogenesis GTPase [Paenibacillus sp. cl123]SFW34298.1 ribosome biogenesis GTPase [Paenibacillus sp. UNCCL117]